ncbi:MAG: alpha/beta hydrolase, partial [Deltaproteobacteria bacterium]|nr:alpha/beta hydrolase [Deltaproteobacteria bacterium]
GESGLSFREAFDSPLAKNFRLFAPDFPGFGVSPFQSRRGSLRGSTRLLGELIDQFSKGRPILLVAHSLGGIVGTWTVQERPKQVRAYISIEGNLTRSDTFFSGLAAKAKSAGKFYHFFKGQILAKARGHEELERYFASLRFADPRALIAWGRSGVEATGLDRSGEEFAGLTCRKIYFWGEESMAHRSREFLRDKDIDHRCFKKCGHWPMIEKPKECYEAISEWLVRPRAACLKKERQKKGQSETNNNRRSGWKIP